MPEATPPDPQGAASKAAPAKIERPFPRRALDQAYRVPTVIREKNGGNPWPADQIAGALGIAVKSSNFLYIMNSARDFGLIEVIKGADGSNLWGLTNLGRQAVYPTRTQSPPKRNSRPSCASIC